MREACGRDAGSHGPEATMNILRFAVAGTAVFIVCSCADGREASAPTAPAFAAQSHSAAVQASPARQVQASGHFDANVDFSTVTLTPRGRNCLLEVDGVLVFTGTIEGTATAHTSALESASCAEVATNPPGTFSDVFKSRAVFVGTVDGTPARANLLYQGQVQPGGHIDARLLFSHSVEGSLVADAVVAVGGDYRGTVVVR
jgi:hypothetical protein